MLLRIFILFIVVGIFSGCEKRRIPRRTVIVYEEEKNEVTVTLIQKKNKKKEKNSKNHGDSIPPLDGKESEKKKEINRPDQKKEGKPTEKGKTEKDQGCQGKKGVSPNDKSSSSGKRGNMADCWCSEYILLPPAAADEELWNNIMQALRKRIYANEVIFSKLGTESSSLIRLPGKCFKASGRCLITDMMGHTIPYTFECTADADRYEARILTSHFSVHDKDRK